MPIEVIAEHSVDTSLLKPGSMILDAGCRGFEFTKHFRALGHVVFAIDIDKLEGEPYIRCGLSNVNGLTGVHRDSDPQATKMMPGAEVPCLTIERIMQFCGVQRFALIKMDIEGAEFNVIKDWKFAPAKQLSIEFHLHTGIYPEVAVEDMVRWLKKLGYKIAKHEKTEAHGCGFNYWDSLFILK